MARIDALFRKMKELGGSDLHLTSGLPPTLRLHGSLTKIAEAPVRHEDYVALFEEILDDERRRTLHEAHDLDFCYELPGVARFRVNMFYQQRGVAGVFRLIPEKVIALEELRPPTAVTTLSELQRGLVLVTGPTGSGKSTTLAAMIDHINRTRRMHILTIEDPIEFTHENKLSLVTQREVGDHTGSFAAALRVASRENPDVILVGELRDLETMRLAISAASYGLLVYGTLHTNSATKTVDRIVDAFPDEERGQVRSMLADSLMGVVAQQLLPKADGKGRVAAHEILIGSPALSNLIREGKTSQIVNLIQAGVGIGMQTMDNALLKLVREGAVTVEAATEKAHDKSLFRNLGKGRGAASPGDDSVASAVR
jgi:twitching motility protein PilT